MLVDSRRFIEENCIVGLSYVERGGVLKEILDDGEGQF
jgi:hypothetical protein